MNETVKLKCPRCKSIFESKTNIPPHRHINCPYCKYERVMRSLDKAEKNDREWWE